MNIEALYTEACTVIRDVQEHVPTLRAYAARCSHVTEFGTNLGYSTAGLLAARPQRLITYDVNRQPRVDQLEKAAGLECIDFVYCNANVLDVTIDYTDMLFIDTLHTYEQIKQELALHAGKVSRYLVFHDVVTFGEHGEVPGAVGLMPAIAEFLQCHPEWVVTARYEHNNGLLILERKPTPTYDRIAVAIPSIVAADSLHQCIEAVMSQEHMSIDLLLIENGPRVAPVCGHWEKQGASVYRTNRNIGVAASWNYACRWAWTRGHDAVMLLNDDLILLGPSTLRQFRICVDSAPRHLYLLARSGFSAVCMTRMVWDEAGEFDQGFWPAYHEDNDMHRRIKLRCIPWSDLDHPAHHLGSASVRSDPELMALNARAFPINQQRYIAKWGGLPEHETYSVPWNGRVPMPSTAKLLAGRPDH
jgi:predicted O-methyltransferase YrrM